MTTERSPRTVSQIATAPLDAAADRGHVGLISEFVSREGLASAADEERSPRRPARASGRSAPLGGRLDRPWPTQQATIGQRARKRRARSGTIAWLDDYGRWRHADLDTCASLSVWTFAPTREPHLHRERMTVCGWVAFGRPEVMRVYESAAERNVLLELDFDHEVFAVASQPFVVGLPDGSEHRPDFAALLTGGRVAIIEVKDDAEARSAHEAEPRSAALGEALGRLGWTYLTLVPSTLSRRRNLRWLRGSRPQLEELDRLTAPMLAAAENGATIGDLAALDHPSISRPVLGWLLWNQQLSCDLNRILCDQRVVWTSVAHESSPLLVPVGGSALVGGREPKR